MIDTATTRPAARRRAKRDGLLTTGDMARLSGSTLRTVRFYEEEGFLRPATRSKGGHRLFQENELNRLTFITDLRAIGLSLDDIKVVLALKARSRDANEAAQHVTDFLDNKIDEMRRQITVLARLQTEFVSSRSALEPCRECRRPAAFPGGCAACESMTNKEIPRTVRLLWSL